MDRELQQRLGGRGMCHFFDEKGFEGGSNFVKFSYSGRFELGDFNRDL